MKKIYKVFASIIFIFSAMLMFFACGEAKTLAKPLTIGIVNNEVYNKETNELEKTEVLLVTDQNKYAKSYKFFITDSSDYENLNNYVSLISPTNSLDITNYFDSRKIYHYFVQYIGKGNYKNSAYSEIKKFTPSPEILDDPYIQLTNTKLSWFRIMNASGYSIYEEKLDVRNLNAGSTKTLLETVDSETFELDLSNRFNSFESPYVKYSYSVVALGEGFYQNSGEPSQKVEYIKEITLSTPINLQVTENENKFYLSWDNVDYVTNYEVVINGNTANPVKTSENQLEITQYLTNYSTFSFSVKSKESDAINYNESGYSDTLNYDYTTKLLAPQNIQVTREGEYINITWDAVNMTQTYTLVVIYNGEEVYEANSLEATSATIEIEAYFGELTTDKDIVIKVKSNAVSHYILESDFEETIYTILKIATEPETEPIE